jgi:hypothetical protein
VHSEARDDEEYATTKCGDVSWWAPTPLPALDREQLGLALGQPLTRGCRLALGAVPIPAAVVRNKRVGAALVLAARDVPAERRRAAALDRTHHLQLLQADVAAVGVTPSGTVVAEDIRDLQT